MPKSISIPNNTHYINLDSYKDCNRVPDNKSFHYKKVRQNACKVRSYYHYKYIKDVCNGLCFFVTLTYNDTNLPYYYNIPCFYRDDIQKFIKLLRYYLSQKGHFTLSYLITKEFGEDKHRPHYHCLFFLDNNNISIKDFIHLVRLSWCGSDYASKSSPSEYSKGGIVSASRKNGYLVNDFRAALYTAKYVCKDCYADAVYKEVRSYIEDLFTKDLYLRTDFLMDLDDYKECNVDYFRVSKHLDRLSDYISDLDTLPDFRTFIKDMFTVRRMYDIAVNLSLIFEAHVKHEMNEFHCRFGVRPMMSQKYGYYALGFVNKNNTLNLPSNNGFVQVPLPSYIFRHLFYDVHFDENTQNNVYCLKPSGIDFFYNKLVERIPEDIKIFKSLIDYYKRDMRKFKNWVVFDEVSMLNDDDYYRLVLYTSVYEGHYYNDSQLSLNLHEDFCRFKTPGFLFYDYYDFNSLESRQSKVSLLADIGGYKSYSTHPEFADLVHLVPLIYEIMDYLFDIDDEKQLTDFVHKTKTSKCYNSLNY
ncbi:replication initiator protein [Capybara microvirus Cap3_SP_352]|nr:replication initiator protein [Capybara microvirus Cap3_SP_352]